MHRSRTLLSTLTTLPWFGRLMSYASMNHRLPTYQWLAILTAGHRQCDALHPRNLSFRPHSTAPLPLIPTLLRQCVHMIHVHSLTNSSGPPIACPPTIPLTDNPAMFSSSASILRRPVARGSSSPSVPRRSTAQPSSYLSLTLYKTLLRNHNTS